MIGSCKISLFTVKTKEHVDTSLLKVLYSSHSKRLSLSRKQFELLVSRRRLKSIIKARTGTNLLFLVSLAEGISQNFGESSFPPLITQNKIISMSAVKGELLPKQFDTNLITLTSFLARCLTLSSKLNEFENSKDPYHN